MKLENINSRQGSCQSRHAPRGSTFGFVTKIAYFRIPLVHNKVPIMTASNSRKLLQRKQLPYSCKLRSARMRARTETLIDSKIDREFFLRIATFATLSAISRCTNVEAETQFSTYKGPISLGFSFSYPSSWAVTKKAIKTHLSEVIVASKDEPSTTAGLVVDAVKIDAIDRFGTPETVGQKVVDVEKKKDSVKDASVQSATSLTKDGLTYYVIDYTVDSTRGQKRYVAKVTVTGNQLYVFTAQAKVDAFQGETAGVFATMLDSFNVVKQYS